MSGAPFIVAQLQADHDRKTFDCGSGPLNRYLLEQVNQDVRRRVAACYVAVAKDGRIAGYYTLASASVALVDLPPEIARKLPRYPGVPAVRMGRLAIDTAFSKQGLGGALLADAIERVERSEIAAFALLVDAKDNAAAAFYLHHGFIALADSPLTLFLPVATALKARQRS